MEARTPLRESRHPEAVTTTERNAQMQLTAQQVSDQFQLIAGALIRRSTGRRGYLRPDGYVYVRINGRSYGEHRAIYLLHYGYMPDHVDHINHVRHDNRPENLRAATSSQNSMNRKRVNSHRGCYWQPKKSRWIVQIGIDRKRLTIGYAKTLDAAIELRARAEREYHREYSS